MRGQQQVRFQEHSIRALRCTIARTLLGGSFRDFAARLADSPLLQWFCRVGQLDRVKVPAKSTLQRYATWLPEEEMPRSSTDCCAKPARGWMTASRCWNWRSPWI